DPVVDVSLRIRLARLGEERLRDNPRVMAREVVRDAVVTHSPLHILRSDPGGVLELLQTETRLIESDPLLGVSQSHPPDLGEFPEHIVGIDDRCLGDLSQPSVSEGHHPRVCPDHYLEVPYESPDLPYAPWPVVFEMVPTRLLLAASDDRYRQESGQLLLHP